jgi:hypothetical protein
MRVVLNTDGLVSARHVREPHARPFEATAALSVSIHLRS